MVVQPKRSRDLGEGKGTACFLDNKRVQIFVSALADCCGIADDFNACVAGGKVVVKGFAFALLMELCAGGCA